jgi:hypothetical protein
VIYLATACPIAAANCNLGSNKSAYAGTATTVADWERLDYVNASGSDVTVYLVVDGENNSAGASYRLHVTIDGPVASAALGSLVITEMLPDPAGNEANCEWAEIYNPTGAAINLQGFDFVTGGGVSTINQPLVISPGEYLVFAYNTNGGTNCGLQQVSWGYRANGGAADIPKNGGTVTIRDGSDATIDSVVFTNSWPYSNGYSMYLCTNHMADATDNNDSANWRQAPANDYGGTLGTENGTPGQVNPGTCN